MNKAFCPKPQTQCFVRHNLAPLGEVCDAEGGRLTRAGENEALAQRGFLDAVGAEPFSVELDDGDPGAVAALELRVAADVDLGEVEVELVAQARELLACALAEVAAGRRVEGQQAQG